MATPEISIGRSTALDAQELVAVMRAEDAAECAAGGNEPMAELVMGIEKSTVANTVRINGEVAAMYGVMPLDGTLLCREAAVWCLTGRVVSRYPKVFLKLCRPLLKELLRLYPVLMNATDVRYGAALRWVRWLGFTIGPQVQLGPHGALFHRIWIGG